MNVLDPRENDIDREIEHSHLEEVNRRKLEVKSGKVALVDGEEVFKRMRELIRK